MSDQAVVTGMSWFIAAVLGHAAVAKFRSSSAFDQYLLDIYPRTPRWVASAVCLAEAALALGFLVPATRGLAALVTLLLLGCATLILVRARAHRPAAACPCFGASPRSHAPFPQDVIGSMLDVARNGLLLACCAWIASGHVGWTVLLAVLPPAFYVGEVSRQNRRDRQLMRAGNLERVATFAPRLRPLVALEWYRPTKGGEVDDVPTGVAGPSRQRSGG